MSTQAHGVETDALTQVYRTFEAVGMALIAAFNVLTRLPRLGFLSVLMQWTEKESSPWVQHGDLWAIEEWPFS